MSRTALGLALMLAISAPFAAADAGFKKALKELRSHFDGKSFVARAPLPISGGSRLPVSPDGTVDREIYLRQLAYSQLFSAGESGASIYFGAKPDKGRLLVGLVPHEKKYNYGLLSIEFGRPLAVDDLRPEVVVRAISRLVEIEGEPQPDDFDAAAIRSLVELAEGSSPTAPIASAAPPSPLKPLIVSLLAAEVEPSRLAPGETLHLRTVFELEGGPGSSVAVRTQYQILKNGQPVHAEPIRRSSDLPLGRQTISSELPIPTDAPDGVYTVTFRASWEGGEAEKSAIFIVETP